ncbi:hypothetical protein B0H10DRAFT_739249 [Mycena sp. CBHHK59/15]|nr:hypothetical protein B0H10DRAFT_739249 [Mycena sp. CBHHK59/15]
MIHAGMCYCRERVVWTRALRHRFFFAGGCKWLNFVETVLRKTYTKGSAPMPVRTTPGPQIKPPRAASRDNVTYPT